MLIFNPNKRWDCAKCMQHPYLSDFYNESDIYESENFIFPDIDSTTPHEILLELLEHEIDLEKIDF